MARVYIDGDKLIIKSVYAERNKCKAVQSSIWNDRHKVWVCPLSIISVADIARIFGRHCLGEDVLRYEAQSYGDIPTMESKTTAWEHQQKAFELAYKHDGFGLFFEMGCGKTKVAIDLACAWEAKTVMVICPRAVLDNQLWPREFKKHCASDYILIPLDNGSVADRTERAKLMLTNGYPTVLVINYEAIIREPFKSWALEREWDLVIADECVIPGTMISTPDGDRAIKNLNVGDIVWGYDHNAKSIVRTEIKHIFSRETHTPLVEIEGVFMTPEHPVWTEEYGYIPAKKIFDMMGYTMIKCHQEAINGIQENQKSVRVVRKRISRPEDTEVLFKKLCRVLGNEFSATSTESPRTYDQAQSQSHQGDDRVSKLRAQSFQESPDCPKTPAQITDSFAREGISNAEWGQWKTIADSAEIACHEVAVADRVCSEYEWMAKSSAMLQDRHCGADVENSYRDRRQESYDKENMEKGCKENSLFGSPRLDRSSILERGSNGGLGNSSEENHGRRVHNLETTTGNYFANGLLVHNCHHLKAPGGKQSHYMALLRDHTEHRLGLTGTPMLHSPLDIYAQYRFLDPAVFGTSFVRFRSRYAVMGGYGNHQILYYQNEAEFTERFQSISYRVTKRDVLDLPPVMIETIKFSLSDKEQRAYDKLETEFYVWLQEAGAEVTVTNALVKLLRLQQVTNGYAKSDEGKLVRLGRSKLDALREILDDLPQDEPLVIFCRFAEEGADLDMIKAEVADSERRCLELSGRMNELTEWQQGDAPVLVTQIQAGAEGVDFTRAAYCVFFSMGFSLGQYEQALARLDRPGQTRPVTYYHITARGTVDEKVIRALKERKAVIESIINDRGGAR